MLPLAQNSGWGGTKEAWALTPSLDNQGIEKNNKEKSHTWGL